MFELFKAYETAKSEKNKFLRKVYIKYTRYRLKRSFFDKFDLSNIEFNKNLLQEFFQLYNCTKDFVNENINVNYPFISVTNIDNGKFSVNYFSYNIFITLAYDEYNTDIIGNDYGGRMITHLVFNDKSTNYAYVKKIILMAIYNYCVSYIYGYKSNLYKDDESYVNKIKDLSII